eukprot:1159476-Pelagomonas_calceolata.AAC.1
MEGEAGSGWHPMLGLTLRTVHKNSHKGTLASRIAMCKVADGVPGRMFLLLPLAGGSSDAGFVQQCFDALSPA